MQKIISKRIKITKNGTLLRRAMGIGHFRAKKSGKSIARKTAYRTLSDIKSIKKIMGTKKVGNH
jgi:ribosomal protein L35